MQETYLDGLSEDKEIPFTVSRSVPVEMATPGVDGPQTRTGVDAGTNVFDLRGMIADLEANPDARKRR